MVKYFHIYNNEAYSPCSDDWFVGKEPLGCTGCGRVQHPYVANVELDPDDGYLCKFTNLTTRTRKRRPKVDIGGQITMVNMLIVEEIGRDTMESVFFIGTISWKSKRVESHVTLVPRDPERALWLRSESPLDQFRCDLCGSLRHAWDGEAHVESDELSDEIYSVACSANSFVVREDVADRLRSLELKELLIEPILIKKPRE